MTKTTKKIDKEFLFSEFHDFSSKEWKQIIQTELKGEDYNQKLVWESIEGIKVKPFYHADDATYLKLPQQKNEFEIAQIFFIDNEKITNKIALEAVKKGAETIILIAEKGFDIDMLLHDFKKSNVKRVVIKWHYFPVHFIQSVIKDFSFLNLDFQLDPISNLEKTGNWFINENQDFEQTGALLEQFTHKNLLHIDAAIYQNAGANIIQQVAYALAHANEYLNLYGHKIRGKISFEFAMGSNYFFEIAKLRAFRYLWAQLTERHNLNIDPFIYGVPSHRNKTLYDYNINILRASTENMSAALGGADVIYSLPYDSFFKKSNEFAERIARNQLILLKAENEFEHAQYYPNGSYYIEALTIEIAKKALELLQDIEKAGGFLYQLKSGTIQKKIMDSADKEQVMFDNGQLVLLGTNKFANPQDKLYQEIELFPFAKKLNEQTTIKPIFNIRLAEKLEQERLKNEHSL